MNLSSIVMLFLWAIPLLLLLLFGAMETSGSVIATYSNIVQMLAAFISAIFCFITMNVFDRGDSSRTGWMFIGLGVLSWGIGQIIYFLYELITKQTVPFPFYTDIFFMLLAVFVMIGIYFLWKSLKSEVPMWGWIVSLVILGLALFWAISLSKTGLVLAAQAGEEITQLGIIVTYLYAILDPLLVFFTVLLASSLLGGIIGNQLWIMIAGFILYFIGDQFFNILMNTGTYKTGGIIDITWPLAFGLIAVAAYATKSALTRRI